MLKEKRTLSQRAALSISYQTTKALNYAHEKGIIHRDIKPENIIMNTKGLVKIADFGIAAASDETSLTATNHIIGTPEYMSPEQARGEILDGRSDLYSLGMVLYEMLIGQTYYEGMSNTNILKELTYKKTEFKLSFESGLSDSLKNLIQALLLKNKDNRLSDIPTLIQEIKNARLELKTTAIRMQSPKTSPPENGQAPLSKTKDPVHDDHSKPPQSIADSLQKKETLILPNIKPAFQNERGKPSQRKGPTTRKKRSLLAGSLIMLLLLGGIGFYVVTQKQETAFPMNDIGEILLEIQAIKKTLLESFKEAKRTETLHWAKDDHQHASGLKKEASKQLETASILLKKQRFLEAYEALKKTLQLFRSAHEKMTQAIKTAQNSIIQQEKLKTKQAKQAQKKAAEEVMHLKEVIKKARLRQKQQEPSLQKAPLKSTRFVPEERSAAFKENSFPRPDEDMQTHEIDSLGAILSQFISAYEGKDLHTLKKISAPSKNRLIFLNQVFKTYQKISVSVTDLSILDEGAEALISITELTRQDGTRVRPPEQWKTAKLIIHKKNGLWSKAIW